MYYVIKRIQCDRCLGVGVVQHPDWEDFFEWFLPKARQQQSWGFQAAVKEWFGTEQPPEEEIECPACGGTGIISQTVPLKEALCALGVEIKSCESLG